MSIVCKAEAISYGRAAIEYAENRTLKEYNEESDRYDKDTGISIADELCRKNLDGDILPEDIVYRMSEWNKINDHEHIKNGFFWISINPSKDTCEKIENGELIVDGKPVTWEDVAEEYMRRMHLDNTMWVAVTHSRSDKEKNGRKHIHILACRTDMDGNLIKEHNIGINSKNVADEMSEHYHLTKAEDIKSDRKVIKSILEEEFDKLKEPNFKKFLQAVKSRGINVEPYTDKAENVKGYNVSIKDNGQVYKLSEIDRGLTEARFTRTFTGREIKEAALNVLINLPKYSFDDYKKALHDCGIEIDVFEKESKGKTCRTYSFYRLKDKDKYQYNATKLDKRLSLANIKSTYEKLRQQNDPKYICREMGIKKIITKKDHAGKCWISAYIGNGHRKTKQISPADFYAWQKHKMSDEQLAAKSLLKDGGKVSSYGANREWEVGVEDDYERNTRRSMGIGINS